MSTKLRVFIVSKSTPKSPPAPQTDVILNADGDAARQDAKTYLETSGMVVRSVNWGPDPGKSDMLIAYVTRKD